MFSSSEFLQTILDSQALSSPGLVENVQLSVSRNTSQFKGQHLLGQPCGPPTAAPEDLPAPKRPAPGPVPARRPNLDPAPVPASLAMHRKQPARPAVAPQGVKVQAPGEFWKDKGEFSSPTFDNASGFRSMPVAGLPSVLPQMRGRLLGKKGAWKTWVVNALVISWIMSGFLLRWVSSPPPQHSGRNHASATTNTVFVDKAVADLVASGTARIWPSQPHLDARAEALLVALGAEVDVELSTLATQLAQVAGQTLAPRTSNDYARSWEPFHGWWVARRLPGSIYDTPGEVVALYPMA
ncbi:hypothetical protein VOLCADRAFT_90991 [Volvox carteri f. nagariensis]|uniref:Uncharacterized protein n=1 Tax=Volvox carteri f. nagariensis TaxID=3068 RepID=D8TVW7_VOLCA|nr:uncharacterized protein VOLCADRAFT_90991 [Volvox carteri f. nagariensis]EFJ48377.1 hypothetical protein VOLCADRAFT_90991 [Volvox carteri f. nagariensis]|eukprot:XP_002950631.1 hypothetical protein VOLCADRAFT_90991 [Volvox carteri f. nagariensis]